MRNYLGKHPKVFCFDSSNIEESFPIHETDGMRLMVVGMGKSSNI